MSNPLVKPFESVLVLVAIWISFRSIYTVATTTLSGPALRTEWAICTADLLVLAWILCREWSAADRDEAEDEREPCQHCGCTARKGDGEHGWGAPVSRQDNTEADPEAMPLLPPNPEPIEDIV